MQNPHWYAEEPLHSPRVTVWMGIGHYGIVGPFFFEENINGPRYLAMLEHQVLPDLHQWPNFKCLVFMQGGGLPHWAMQMRAPSSTSTFRIGGWAAARNNIPGPLDLRI